MRTDDRRRTKNNWKFIKIFAVQIEGVGLAIFRTNFTLFAIIHVVSKNLPNWGVYIGRGGGR
jgi:hypothetical protein